MKGLASCVVFDGLDVAADMLYKHHVAESLTDDSVKSNALQLQASVKGCSFFLLSFVVFIRVCVAFVCSPFTFASDVSIIMLCSLLLLLQGL